SHLHEQGIVHGNLSPSNFQITRLVHKDWPRGLPEIGELVVKPDEELPIVIDFRLARLMPTSSKNDTGLTGKDEGDPLYMSPEQCLIAKIDPRRDIYSMGCAMYFALTGKPPFQGDSDTETMQMHLDTQPEANLLPAEVRHVVLKAMAKNPDDRVQTMGELAKALEARAVTSETKS
ncbi:MAG: protein kinase, partial [Cyanobacteria bacterium]|nr:protein kinase [Cyanobacteriota bacterium]